MNTRNLPIHYDYYLKQSERWAEVFSEVQLGKELHVVELCSGWSPKIGLALARYGFVGQFTLADRSEEAVALGTELLSPVVGSFTLHQWTGSILDDELPSADVLILNHAFDDILLDAYLRSQTDKELEYSSIEELRADWEAGSVWMKEHQEMLAKQLVAHFEQALSDGGLILFDQYPGYQEQLYQLQTAIERTAEFQRTIERCLNNNFEKVALQDTQSTKRVWRLRKR